MAVTEGGNRVPAVQIQDMATISCDDFAVSCTDRYEWKLLVDWLKGAKTLSEPWYCQ